VKEAKTGRVCRPRQPPALRFALEDSASIPPGISCPLHSHSKDDVYHNGKQEKDQLDPQTGSDELGISLRFILRTYLLSYLDEIPESDGQSGTSQLS
jgi:hypothetical protein